MTAAQTPSAKNLSSAFLELGRVLANRDGMTFRAKGTCMYPTVRAGDILRIRSCPAAEVQLGDIAVFRRMKYLFAHRVIEKGETNGRAYIVTRPDGRRESGESPVFEDDLLGVVVSIERSGRKVPIEPNSHRWPMRFYFASHAALQTSASLILARWAVKLAFLQTCVPYKELAKLWVTVRYPRRVYRVRLPVPALGEAVFQEVTPEKFNFLQDWRGRPVQRWTLALHFDTGREPAASATMTSDQNGLWNVAEFTIRPWFRGAGLEAALVHKIDDLLRKAGATRANATPVFAPDSHSQPLALGGE